MNVKGINAETMAKMGAEVQAKAKAAAEAKAKAAAEAKAKETARRQGILDAADESTVSGRIQKQAGMAGFDDARTQDILKGAQFGESVLGPEGLGRLGESDTLKAMEAQAAELAKGYSSEEMLARKERGIEEIQGSTAAQSRAVQAQLARAGVKGAAAGTQLAGVAMSGIEARGNLERDLMIANRQAQMEGLGVQRGIFQERTARTQFDLSQAAKEKDIALQAGLGFAQMGSTERAAELNRQAQIKAARASKPRSCHVAGTPVMMQDGSYKNIEDLKIGDQLAFGGTLVGKGEMLISEQLYNYNGEIVTGSHFVLNDEFEYVTVESQPEAKPVTTDDKVVYPLYTENGCYFTSFLNGDFAMEASFKEERKCILEELMKETRISLKSGSIA